jgi:hypothetical protein
VIRRSLSAADRPIAGYAPALADGRPCGRKGRGQGRGHKNRGLLDLWRRPLSLPGLVTPVRLSFVGAAALLPAGFRRGRIGADLLIEFLLDRRIGSLRRFLFERGGFGEGLAWPARGRGGGLTVALAARACARPLPRPLPEFRLPLLPQPLPLDREGFPFVFLLLNLVLVGAD